MSKTKLVIVEGIPGAGKTTTARFIRDWLAGQGFQPRLYLEGDLDHPADFESVACLSLAQYARLLGRFPAARPLLEQHKQALHGEIYLGYRKLQNEFGSQLPPGLFASLARFEVYELPVRKFLRVTAAHWVDFTLLAQGEPFTYVFECCFLQNPLTTLLARHNLEPQAACAHILRVAERAKTLDPLVIYLDPPSIRQTLEKVAASRPREWLDYVIHYVTGQRWGPAHAQAGFECMVNFYPMRRDVEQALFPRLPWHGLWLEGAGLDWEQDYVRIEAFLKAFST